MVMKGEKNTQPYGGGFVATLFRRVYSLPKRTWQQHTRTVRDVLTDVSCDVSFVRVSCACCGQNVRGARLTAPSSARTGVDASTNAWSKQT